MGASAALKYHCPYRRFAYSVLPTRASLRVLEASLAATPSGDSCRRHSQAGSLAGAAHLLKDNAGVPRGAPRAQKSRMDQKGKRSLDFDFQYEYKL